MRLRGPRPLAALAVLAPSVCVAGCGADDVAPPRQPPETVDRLPKLPDGWKPYVNHRAGFAIGRPPGWCAERDDATTLLRSPDRLVAVSISADRTTEAIEFPLDEYAVLIAQNAEQESGFYAREALRLVRTLRGRPIG